MAVVFGPTTISIYKDWPDFKPYIDGTTKHLFVQAEETSQEYHLFATDAGMLYTSVIYKDGYEPHHWTAQQIADNAAWRTEFVNDWSIPSVLNHQINFQKGRSIGGFIPEPYSSFKSSDIGERSVFQTDSAGQLAVRGAALTDEGSYRDDFTETSFDTLISGTVTFINGETRIIGSGTAFKSDLDSHHLIKLSTDAENAYMVIDYIESDTLLYLAYPYQGSSGSGDAHTSHWTRVTGTGASITMGSSKAVLASGTTDQALTYIGREVDYGPLVLTARANVTQRIANQIAKIGFSSNTEEGITEQAYFSFLGTNNTQVNIVTAASANPEDTETNTVSLPAGLTTAQNLKYEIDLGTQQVGFLINGVLVGVHSTHIPGPYTIMNGFVSIENTGIPASSSSIEVDSIFFSNQDQVQITQHFSSETIPVSNRDDFHYATGVLTTTSTTADQVIVSFTVPSGKVCYIGGFTLSSSSGNVSGEPVKLGKNTVTTISAAPGQTDSNIFRAFSYVKGASPFTEYYGSAPRRLAIAGDVVKLTVSPSGSATTVWYGTIDYVLRQF